MKDAYLTTRVDLELRSRFRAKAEKYGVPSEVLRELITAFVEDRVTIEPPNDVKESLYDNRSED